MTLDEIIHTDKVFLTAAEIAPILHCDPQCIRRQAQTRAFMLGFPTVVQGARVRIPRIPFLKFMGVI